MHEKVVLNCPICSWNFAGQDFRTTPYLTEKNNKMLPQNIGFFQNCGVGVAYPTLSNEQLTQLYTTGDFWQKSEVKILLPKSNPGHYASAMARWKLVKPYVKDKASLSVLDIGAGYGFFGMVIAQDKDVKLKEYSVVEPDPVFRESLSKTWEKYDGQIKYQITDRIEKINGQYDLIVLSHVLEHLKDPKAELKVATDRLANQGFVFADVPNQDYRFKKNVFPHIIFFNLSSLEKLFAQNGLGLELKSIACYGRNIEQSPVNYRVNSWEKIIELIFYRIRQVLPLFLLTKFFNWYYGADQQNPDGTWIRALAQNSGSHR